MTEVPANEGSTPAFAATELVRREWTRRVAAEYRSSAHTQHLTLWLIQLGAPRELIDDGLRIVADELDHAELSAAVCQAAASAQQPKLAQEQLQLQVGTGSLQRRCLAACLEVFCLGETLAVPLFAELRRECIVPAARAVLDRVLKDEVRHRAFGWELLDYLLERFPQELAAAQSLLLPAFARLTDTYGSQASLAITSAERAWGLMAPAQYGRILLEATEREFRPRFRERGLSLEAPHPHG